MHTYVPLANVKIVYPNNKIKVEKSLIDQKCGSQVFCNGDDADSMHPKVYISLKSGTGKCPYCGIIFKKMYE